MREAEDKPAATERPDAFWRRVYAAVVVVTVAVIAALWAFSRYFSS
jgi:hypothetical protein